jgi:hypothetical protein
LRPPPGDLGVIDEQFDARAAMSMSIRSPSSTWPIAIGRIVRKAAT